MLSGEINISFNEMLISYKSEVSSLSCRNLQLSESSQPNILFSKSLYQWSHPSLRKPGTLEAQGEFYHFFNHPNEVPKIAMARGIDKEPAFMME